MRIAAVNERPILFSAPMVRAILEGRKAVTRRVVKAQQHTRADIGHLGSGMPFIRAANKPMRCPYGQPGDQLWVRETWGQLYPLLCDDEPVFWRADYSDEELREQLLPKWRPSIHMYRWASRITLEVTGVRVERLHDMSTSDILAEGIRIPVCVETGNTLLDISTKHGPVHFLGESWREKLCDADLMLRAHWSALWVSINGIDSWNNNPWVWVIEFRRIEQEIKAA